MQVITTNIQYISIYWYFQFLYMNTIMDIMKVLRDSIETSILLKLFTNKEESTMKHIFNSKLVKFPLSKCKNLEILTQEDLRGRL